MRLLSRRAAILLAAPALLPRPARAQRWPSDRPVRIVVPLAAGGTADFLARSLANRLAEATGASFLVENRTGGGGAVGWQTVARATADGATLLITDNSLPIAAAAGRDIGMDARTDLEPVALLAQFPPILSVHPGVPARDLAGFIAHAKERPGALFYGSGGIGSVPHLQVELLQDLTGIRLNHVAYRGMAPAVTDLLAGQVQLALPVFPTAAGQLRAGSIRPLAVGGTARIPALPDVPTAREAGVDFVQAAWFGIMAPRATTAEAVARMQAAIAAATADTGFRQRLEEMGATVPAGTTAEFRETADRETALWTRLLRERNIRVE